MNEKEYYTPEEVIEMNRRYTRAVQSFMAYSGVDELIILMTAMELYPYITIREYVSTLKLISAHKIKGLQDLEDDTNRETLFYICEQHPTLVSILDERAFELYATWEFMNHLSEGPYVYRKDERQSSAQLMAAHRRLMNNLYTEGIVEYPDNVDASLFVSDLQRVVMSYSEHKLVKGTTWVSWWRETKEKLLPMLIRDKDLLETYCMIISGLEEVSAIPSLSQCLGMIEQDLAVYANE